MGKEIKILNKKEKEEMEATVVQYVDKVLFNAACSDVFNIPQETKLAFLQYTRPSWKKSRQIGSYKDDNGVWQKEYADYIPIRKAERLLNFLFNFNWGSKLIEQKFETDEIDKMEWNAKEKKKVKTGTTIINEAFVIMEFTCLFFGKEVKRTVSGSWKMYDNPAVSKFAVIQAAISQATKNFAKLYGIGADLNDDIEDRFSESAKVEESPEAKEKEVADDMSELIEDFNNNAK